MPDCYQARLRGLGRRFWKVILADGGLAEPVQNSCQAAVECQFPLPQGLVTSCLCDVVTLWRWLMTKGTCPGQGSMQGCAPLAAPCSHQTPFGFPPQREAFQPALLPGK